MRFMPIKFVAVLAIAVNFASGQDSAITQQLSTPQLVERNQRALFPIGGDNVPFRLNIKGVAPPAKIDNGAALQLQGDKGAFPFLATLPGLGSAVFLTALKPCGVLLPHVHQRATEQYVIISGTMSAGIAEENGGRQNVTFDLGPGQSFVVPQGLLHFNTNKQCVPNVFIQVFNSNDPGALNVIGALAALKGTDAASITASNAASVTASAQGAFSLDKTCLTKCNLPETGGNLSGLGADLQAFLGLAGAPGGSPTAPPTPTPSTQSPPTPSTQSPPTPTTQPPPAPVVQPPPTPVTTPSTPSGYGPPSG